MPAQGRIVYPGIPHHITQRGNRKQQVFFKRADFHTYLTFLGQACIETKAIVLAWCLMPNHVHLIVVPVDSDGLRKTLAHPHRLYARMINERMGWTGHLWQDRFSSFPLDEAHLLAAARYIELNPVRAGLVESPERWIWSSARAHLEARTAGITHLPGLLELCNDWSELLASGMADFELDRFREHTHSGKPLGTFQRRSAP